MMIMLGIKNKRMSIKWETLLHITYIIYYIGVLDVIKNLTYNKYQWSVMDIEN